MEKNGNLEQLIVMLEMNGIIISIISLLIIPTQREGIGLIMRKIIKFIL